MSHCLGLFGVDSLGSHVDTLFFYPDNSVRFFGDGFSFVHAAYFVGVRPTGALNSPPECCGFRQFRSFLGSGVSGESSSVDLYLYLSGSRMCVVSIPPFSFVFFTRVAIVVERS